MDPKELAILTDFANSAHFKAMQDLANNPLVRHAAEEAERLQRQFESMGLGDSMLQAMERIERDREGVFGLMDAFERHNPVFRDIEAMTKSGVLDDLVDSNARAIRALEQAGLGDCVRQAMERIQSYAPVFEDRVATVERALGAPALEAADALGESLRRLLQQQAEFGLALDSVLPDVRAWIHSRDQDFAAIVGLGEKLAGYVDASRDAIAQLYDVALLKEDVSMHLLDVARDSIAYDASVLQPFADLGVRLQPDVEEADEALSPAIDSEAFPFVAALPAVFARGLEHARRRYGKNRHTVGMLCMRFKEYEEALDQFEEACDHLDDPGPHVDRAVALHWLGRHEEALEAFAEAERRGLGYAELSREAQAVYDASAQGRRVRASDATDPTEH